jgi:hypothetical protein
MHGLLIFFFYISNPFQFVCLLICVQSEISTRYDPAGIFSEHASHFGNHWRSSVLDYLHPHRYSSSHTNFTPLLGIRSRLESHDHIVTI